MAGVVKERYGRAAVSTERLRWASSVQMIERPSTAKRFSSSFHYKMLSVGQVQKT